ncbi:unnamed protein product [Boreogadus saida]
MNHCSTVKWWNELPAEVRIAESLTRFHKRHSAVLTSAERSFRRCGGNKPLRSGTACQPTVDHVAPGQGHGLGKRKRASGNGPRRGNPATTVDRGDVFR